MTTVHRFSELNEDCRQALFAFIQNLGGSHWFSTYDEMIGNYAGGTFGNGDNHLSAWDNGQPVGALGVIAATTAETGEAMLVSPYLLAGATEAFAGLLAEATGIARAAFARRLILQLDERTAWARTRVEQLGFTLSHESLTLRHSGAQCPPLPDGLTVSRLTAEDAAAYARIDHDAFIDSPNGVPITVRDLLTQMGDPDTRFFLGRWQGEPMAVAELWLRGGDGWIQSLGVSPAFQERGSGRALLHFATDYLHRCGFSTVRLSVMSANPRALQLYLSDGFVRERVTSIWLIKDLHD